MGLEGQLTEEEVTSLLKSVDSWTFIENGCVGYIPVEESSPPIEVRLIYEKIKVPEERWCSDDFDRNVSPSYTRVDYHAKIKRNGLEIGSLHEVGTSGKGLEILYGLELGSLHKTKLKKLYSSLFEKEFDDQTRFIRGFLKEKNEHKS